MLGFLMQLLPAKPPADVSATRLGSARPPLSFQLALCLPMSGWNCEPPSEQLRVVSVLVFGQQVASSLHGGEWKSPTVSCLAEFSKLITHSALASLHCSRLPPFHFAYLFRRIILRWTVKHFIKKTKNKSLFGTIMCRYKSSGCLTKQN